MSRLRFKDWLSAFNPVRREQAGFAMPVIIILMALMAITAYAVLAQSSNSLTLTYRQSYLQMARVASKAAIDYAKEQFDNSSCGNYSGTTERDLVSNNNYRLTIKADVLSTSADGLTKNVQGTGSVYLPRTSTSARYVFSIDSQIINTFNTCKTPADYGPLIWLDASDTTTLIGQITDTIHKTTAFGVNTDTTRDTLQELASNGSQTTNSWRNKDMQMSICSASDFNNSTCTSNATKYLYDGTVFKDVDIPQGATILSATLTLVGDTPAGSGGSETNQIVGLYQSSSNPYTPLFTSTGSNQLKTPINTASRHTSSSVNFTTNNLPPGNNFSFSILPIVQEMVNSAHWDEVINDGKNDQNYMGFGIKYVSGSGSRNMKKDGLALDITYLTIGSGTAANGGSVAQWNDKSGNGNNAVQVYGNNPTRQDNQINAKTIVRFNNGAMVSNLIAAITNSRELTTFAVVKPAFSTSASDGRFVSGTSTTVSGDGVSGSSIIPLMRYASNTGFSNSYNGTGSAYRLNHLCSPSCNNTPDLFATLFQIRNSTTVDSFLRLNGAQVAEKDGLNPGGSPYVFGLNQFYFGGTRSGNLPGSGASYLNGDYAELIIYNKALSCYEVESVENYLRNKWGLAATAYDDTCPPPNIPTL